MVFPFVTGKIFLQNNQIPILCNRTSHVDEGVLEFEFFLIYLKRNVFKSKEVGMYYSHAGGMDCTVYLMAKDVYISLPQFIL